MNFPRGALRPASLDAVRAEVRTKNKNETSSRYIGVWRDGDRKERPWFAMFTRGRKGLPIGRYRTEREAAIAHDRAALFYRPKRAQLNFPKLARKLGPASVDDLANPLLHENKRKTKSRFIGVTWNGFSFQAVISHKNRSMYLGSFEVEEEAARVRQGRASAPGHADQPELRSGNRARDHRAPEGRQGMTSPSAIC